MNDFARRCVSKGKVSNNAVKKVHLRKQRDSSDAESLCGIEEIGAVESNLRTRPIKSIKIETCVVNVLN